MALSTKQDWVLNKTIEYRTVFSTQINKNDAYQESFIKDLVKSRKIWMFFFPPD